MPPSMASGLSVVPVPGRAAGRVPPPLSGEDPVVQQAVLHVLRQRGSPD